MISLNVLLARTVPVDFTRELACKTPERLLINVSSAVLMSAVLTAPRLKPEKPSLFVTKYGTGSLKELRKVALGTTCPRHRPCNSVPLYQSILSFD